MRLLIVGVLITMALGDKLQSNYLPPSSAKTAGGSRFLTAPRASFGGHSSYTKSDLATSYAAPASGPAPSGLYNTPVRTSYTSGGKPIAILKLDNDNQGDGSYRFAYETENKIIQQEEGHLQNAGTDHEVNAVSGSYSYQSPEGQTITVHYVADENGFRATGDHIPTPPPIPQAIQRSLEINAAAPSTSGYSSGGYESRPLYHVQPSRQYLAPKTTHTGGYSY